MQNLEETYIKEEKVEEDIRINIEDHFFNEMRKTGLNDVQIGRVAEMSGFGLKSPFSGKGGILFKKTIFSPLVLAALNPQAQNIVPDPTYSPLPPSEDSPGEPDYDSATPPQRPSTVVGDITPLPPTEREDRGTQ